MNDNLKGVLFILQAFVFKCSTVIIEASKVAELLKPILNDFFLIAGTFSAIYGAFKLSKKKD